MKQYEIVDWGKHYENNRTRELKHMAWVPIPNKQDGDGYTELLDHPNGAAHFGAWNALLQVASKCDPRGTLLRDSGYPHDTASLARMTRIPEKVWNEVLPRLASIGWITFCDIPHEGAVKPQDGAGECLRTEGNRTTRKEGNRGEKTPPAYTPEFDGFWERYGGPNKTANAKAPCYKLWLSLSDTDRLAAAGRLQAYLDNASEPKYIAKPSRYLAEKLWTGDFAAKKTPLSDMAVNSKNYRDGMP